MCKKLDTFTVDAFLKTLRQHRACGVRMIILSDNVTCHYARRLKPWLQKSRRVLRFLFLLPRIPQLAPIERVWKLIRRMATHNRFFATLSELLVTVEPCFPRWQKPNAVLRNLCGIS